MVAHCRQRMRLKPYRISGRDVAGQSCPQLAEACPTGCSVFCMPHYTSRSWKQGDLAADECE